MAELIQEMVPSISGCSGSGTEGLHVSAVRAARELHRPRQYQVWLLPRPACLRLPDCVGSGNLTAGRPDSAGVTVGVAGSPHRSLQ
jgi:hypothetical protein